MKEDFKLKCIWLIQKFFICLIKSSCCFRMKIEKKILNNFSSSRLRNVKVPNFTSVWVQCRARWETGEHTVGLWHQYRNVSLVISLFLSCFSCVGSISAAPLGLAFPNSGWLSSLFMCRGTKLCGQNYEWDCWILRMKQPSNRETTRLSVPVLASQPCYAQLSHIAWYCICTCTHCNQNVIIHTTWHNINYYCGAND